MNPVESFDQLFGLVIALAVYAFVRWLQYHYPDPPPRRGRRDDGERRGGEDRRSGRDRRDDEDESGEGEDNEENLDGNFG